MSNIYYHRHIARDKNVLEINNMLFQSFKFLSVDMKLLSLSVIIIVYILLNVRYQ